MGKELNFVDAPVVDTPEVAIRPEIVKLDDLSLALVGGGAATVLF